MGGDIPRKRFKLTEDWAEEDIDSNTSKLSSNASLNPTRCKENA